MIPVRFTSFVRWRWASSVALVIGACVPVVAAALLIPGEVSSPLGQHATSLRLPSPPRHTETSAPAFDAVSEAPTPRSHPPTVVATAPTPTVPARTAIRRAAAESGPPRARTQGYFVPEGETDDSRAIEPQAAVNQ